MKTATAARFKFIGQSLRGDGGFRPVVVSTGRSNEVHLTGETELVRYPRESALKFARRNEIAFYTSPLARACSRFVGYLMARPPARETGHDLYRVIADDLDGKGNAAGVFLSSFMVDAKARGSMLLQVDMPTDTGATKAEQVQKRRLPYWIPLAPELVTEYALGDDGKFDFVEYAGTVRIDGDEQDCTWRFDRQAWEARDKHDRVLSSGQHPLGECPVLIFSEGNEYPTFGPFASIADVARRLYNAESELDELLRSQTFSLLHMQVPDGASDDQKLAAARVAGEAIGTQNLLVHSGASAPGFIAPPDGPARVYLDRIKRLEAQIDEIGLNVATVNQQESGLAMRMRFAAINAELAAFAARMEDLERRAWDLTRRWLGMQQAPEIRWSRDYNLADAEEELRVLQQMRQAAMPAAVIAEQERRIASVQFAGLDADRMDEINRAIDERLHEPNGRSNATTE